MKNITYRTFRIAPEAAAQKEKPIRAAILTDNPVQDFDMVKFFRGEDPFITRILMMQGCQMPEDKRMPLIDSHDRSTIFNSLGSIQEMGCDEHNMSGDLMFDSTEEGQKARTKVTEGHIRDMSGGFEVMETEFVKKDEKKTIMGREFEGPVEVATKWKPHEGSLTIIGADRYAKVMRSEKEIRDILEQVKNGMLKREDLEPMLEKLLQNNNPDAGVSDRGKNNPTITQRSHAMTPEEQAAQDKLTLEAKQRQEKERKESIERAGKDFASRIKGGAKRMDAMVKDAIALDIPFEQFRGKVYDLIDDNEPLETDSPANVGMSEKDVANYSITRAINAQIEKENCFEKEVSQQIETRIKERGMPFKRQGILIPREIRQIGLQSAMLRSMGFGQRAQTVASATGGGNLVGTNLIPELIPYLRPRLLREVLGMRYLSGVTGKFSYPRQTGASTFAIVSEGNAASESALTFGQVPFVGFEASIWVEYTRKLLAQGTPGIDNIINEDINAQTELGWEHLIFHGAGTTEPTGVEITTGIGAVVGAGIGHDGVVDFSTEILTANAMFGVPTWLSSATTSAILKKRPESTTGGFARWLLEKGECDGKPYVESENITDGYLFHGNYSKIVVADWDMYDLIVNPFSKDKEGIIRVSLRTMRDSALVQPAAIAMANDIS